jgi:FkbM family methyltransferase
MIKKLLKALFPDSLKKELRDSLGVPSQSSSLTNLKALGFTPKYCLDIGAYTGNWTRDFKEIYPDCAVLMIEGQTELEGALLQTKNLYKDVNYKIALLGSNEDTVSFNKYDTASSVLNESNVTNALIEQRQLCLLDNLKALHEIKADFIKIDTQGYELEVLRGGEQTLLKAKVVLLEVSFIDVYINCPLAADVINFMNERGFVVYDICTLMRRPYDKALYQADMLFVRKNSFLREVKRWS